ncbi:MAG TPA: hypothetical protein PLP42_17575 [Acidobacteriota bacterium]|nr:hypothetical protein [Acidobacteriota bacterium]
MGRVHERPTIEEDGWTLLSAEDRQAASPHTFIIPSREERKSVSSGDAVKLLFDIETREGGEVFDRGVDRMWVIVKSCKSGRYIGVLDSDPGVAENLNLYKGDTIVFGPEHIAEISKPPHEYIIQRYGSSFFED